MAEQRFWFFAEVAFMQRPLTANKEILLLNL
jgi:hypothetical protein